MIKFLSNQKNGGWAAAAICASTFLFNPTASYAGVSPGSACMPATLAQAVNLGFTTNQFGVSDPGTGPFYVVCPIAYEGMTDYSSAFVGINYTTSGSHMTNCIVRLATFDNSSLNGITLTLTKSGTGYTQTAVSVASWNELTQTNPTIVCPLGPGDTLIWYGVN